MTPMCGRMAGALCAVAAVACGPGPPALALATRPRFQAQPPGGAALLRRLVPTGQHFVVEGGGRITIIGHSDFHLLGRFLSREDITPILRQRQAAGYNTLRVWTRYRLSNYGIGDSTLAQHPDLYTRLPAFLDTCARFGLYVELTAYSGREDFDPQHWTRLTEAARGAMNVLLELVNENDQRGNHIDTAPFSPPDGMLASHGSNGAEQPPVKPFWGYADFHTNGALEEQRKVGHSAMEIWNGPTVTFETSRFPDVGMWVRRGNESREDWLTRVNRLAFDAGAGAALLAAGAAFHDVHGKDSTLWDDDTAVVAKAFADGMRSVPLTCQDGPYRRREDLEKGHPLLLRVYERPVEAVNCVVSIRR